MKVLITGGTGFIGQRLIEKRLAAGDEIYCLTRDPKKVHMLFPSEVSALSELPKPDEIVVDAVINLAGEPILDERWSDKRKQQLKDSRIKFTHDLVAWIGQQTNKPKTLISGSAIGFYGSQAEGILDEESPSQPGFTYDLCSEWEKAAFQAKEFNLRVCTIRTGIVLGEGGALTKMIPPFKLGLGGPIGKGSQWMSWIHIDDEIDIIEMLLTHEHLDGSFNLTSPKAVTNRQFSSTLGAILKRPAFIPMPGFVMKLLLGEGAELLLEGQNVYPKKLLDMGYEFKFAELEPALRAVVDQ